MNIILDSNIFRSDITLRSKEFDIILDYLEKTGSFIILPEIIYDEIKGLYARLLVERKLELTKHINNINLLLTQKSDYLEIQEIDKDIQIKNYENFIRIKLKISDRNILPYKNEFLPIIAKRAIDRIKPAGDKGQGFRDALIWLTMLEYCKTCHEGQVVFISNNTDDFASADKMTLHESLEKECTDSNVKINYFKSLKEFIENHSNVIDYISDDWLIKNIDNDTINHLVLDFLNGVERNNVTHFIEQETWEECNAYEASRFDAGAISGVTVYEMLDNRHIVNATMEGYVDFDFHLTIYNRDFGEYGTTVHRYENVIVEFSFTIINKEIIDIEISDITI